MDNKDYLKKILSAGIHIADKNKLDESLEEILNGDSGVTSWNDLQDKPFGEGEAITILPQYTFTLTDVSDGVKFGAASFSELGTNGQGFNIGDTVIIHAISQTYEVVATASQEDCLFGPGLPEAKVVLNSALKFSLICDTKRTVLEEEEGFLLISDGYPANKFIIAAEVRGVKTIDPKYLPKTSGGNMIIQVEDHIGGGEEANLIADKTYDEIYEAVQQGVVPVCVYGHQLYHLTFAHGLDGIVPALERSCFSFVSVDMHTYSGQVGFSCIEIDAGNNVSYQNYNITVSK